MIRMAREALSLVVLAGGLYAWVLWMLFILAIFAPERIPPP